MRLNLGYFDLISRHRCVHDERVSIISLPPCIIGRSRCRRKFQARVLDSNTIQLSNTAPNPTTLTHPKLNRYLQTKKDALAAHAWLRTVREQNLQPARLEMERIARSTHSDEFLNAEKAYVEAWETKLRAREAHNTARLARFLPCNNCDNGALLNAEELACAAYGIATRRCEITRRQLDAATTVATKAHGIAGGCDG